MKILKTNTNKINKDKKLDTKEMSVLPNQNYTIFRKYAHAHIFTFILSKVS